MKKLFAAAFAALLLTACGGEALDLPVDDIVGGVTTTTEG